MVTLLARVVPILPTSMSLFRSIHLVCSMNFITLMTMASATVTGRITRVNDDLEDSLDLCLLMFRWTASLQHIATERGQHDRRMVLFMLKFLGLGFGCPIQTAMVVKGV